MQGVVGIRGLGPRPMTEMSRDVKSWLGYAFRLMVEDPSTAIQDISTHVRTSLDQDWYDLTPAWCTLCQKVGMALVRSHDETSASAETWEDSLSDSAWRHSQVRHRWWFRIWCLHFLFATGYV